MQHTDQCLNSIFKIGTKCYVLFQSLEHQRSNISLFFSKKNRILYVIVFYDSFNSKLRLMFASLLLISNFTEEYSEQMTVHAYNEAESIINGEYPT